MKLTFVWLSLALWAVMSYVPAAADGLLYQLPEDGTWVQYEAKIAMTQGDNTRDATGTLRMSSVGAVTEGGKKCRWIEVNMTMVINGNKRAIVAKLLVPEAHLKEGGKPVENRVRGWIRMNSGSDIVELADEKPGPLPAFLSNPLTDVKLLKAITVNSKLGDLSCPGLTGHTEFTERRSTNKVTFETRRHERAPFGVVSSKMKISVEQDGKPAQILKMDMTLSDYGKSASSELTDQW